MRQLAKRVLPEEAIHWYRRRRALRRYLKDLAYELYDRSVKLDLEGLQDAVLTRRHGVINQVIGEILERTELVMQELDRKIEGAGARSASELRELRAEVAALRDEVARLRDRDGAPTA